MGRGRNNATGVGDDDKIGSLTSRVDYRGAAATAGDPDAVEGVSQRSLISLANVL